MRGAAPLAGVAPSPKERARGWAACLGLGTACASGAGAARLQPLTT
jgi:hypothetical protein